MNTDTPGLEVRIPRFHRVLLFVLAGLMWSAQCGLAQSMSGGAAAPGMPEAGVSVLRVLGALVFVLALFFAGVWLFKNWQRMALPAGRTPKLNVLEVRSLGHRHALYVVAYEQQRLLLAASPTGITLVSHLPAAEADSPEPAAPAVSFAQALQQVLGRSR